MPASVYATIARLGAKPIVAEREFSWQMEPDSGEPPRWRYRGARLSLADLPPSVLAGSIQYRNAATALAALEALAIDSGSTVAAQVVAALDARTVAEGLRRVRLAGRFQIVPGPVEWILDIAHNEPAAEVLAAQLRQRPCQGRTLGVVGILGDKDAPAIARALRPALDRWFLCGLEGPRGISAAELARRLEPSVQRADPGRLRGCGLRGGARCRAGGGSCGRLRLRAHCGTGARVAWGILRAVKERLTGAIILVALIVLLVPELLTGPIRMRSAPAAAATATTAVGAVHGEPPLRSYTMTLGSPPAAEDSPAATPAQAPSPQAQQPMPSPQAGPPENSTPSPPPAAAQGGSPGSLPDSLQGTNSPAHTAVEEGRSSASSAGWVVQLGSFAGRQNAERLARSLKSRGFRMSVSPARGGSRVLWRVRAGPARNHAAAVHLASRLRALGHRGEILPVR